MAHSTNYTNTLITVAGDYKHDHAIIAKEGTIGALQLAVSYTHLDVYKRQVLGLEHGNNFAAVTCYSALYGLSGFMACLLYTSRCV